MQLNNLALVNSLTANLHSWVEISRERIVNNLKKIKDEIGAAQLGVIIKANAYGHGIVPIVEILQQTTDVDWLIAFSLTEALLARKAGFTRNILVCGYADGLITDAIAQNIDLVVHDLASLARCPQAVYGSHQIVNIHLKVDTGLNRLGFSADQILKIILDLKKQPQIILRGLFTHFADSDAPDNWYAQQQVREFENLLAELAALKIKIPLIHMANTIAVFRLPSTCKSLVRVGGGVYGLRKTIAPALIGPKYHELQPAITWKSKIIQVRQVPAHSYISYGCTYKTTKNTLIATIPVGYADGYGRELSNNSVIYVNGSLAPVVGRICMNLMMIDVSHIANVQVNTPVILLGDFAGVSVNDLMLRLKTIACDVTTRINWTISRFIV